MQIEAFWTSSYAERIQHPEPVRQVLNAVSDDQDKFYDLTFYAAFAKKMFTIMRREGKDTQGFARMQQSFSEAVQKVRDVLTYAATKGFSRAYLYTELSQQGMTHLLELIDDLSTIKDWQVHEGDGKNS